MKQRGPQERSAPGAPGSPRRWGALLALGASGWLGILPGEGGLASSDSILTWLALWAAPAGVLAGARVRGALAPLALLPWVALLLLVGGDLPARLLGAAAVAVLFGGGLVVGYRQDPGRSWAWCGGALLLAGGLAAAPSLGGGLSRPLPPAWAARLLDLSPVVYVTECAGRDAMRHPAFYERAGAGDLGPERRSPYGGTYGTLATLLLVSLATAFTGRTGRSARAGDADIPCGGAP